MSKIKSIRLLAYIVDKTDSITGYLVVNTQMDAITGVSFEQLCAMKDAVVNIKSIDKNKRKITFTDCASDRVPKVRDGGLGGFGTVKDGVWVVNKIEDADEFTCYTQRGDKVAFSTKELIVMHRQGILVNATVVQNSFIRGINWAIPVIENPCKIKGLKHVTLFVEGDGVVSFEIDAEKIKLTKEELALMSETDANSGLGVMQTIKFGNKDIMKVTGLLTNLLEEKRINTLEVYLKDTETGSELGFKAREGEHVNGNRVKIIDATKNANVCANKLEEITSKVMEVMYKNDIMGVNLANEVTRTVSKYKQKVAPAGEYIKNLELVGLAIEMCKVHTFITVEVIAEAIKVPKSVEHKIDKVAGDGVNNTYLQYVTESYEDAVKFLKMFLKGVKAEKVAVVLVDRVEEDNVSQVFIEATKGEQTVIKTKNDGKYAVTLCKDTLDEILGSLAKYSLLDTTLNADVHKALKRIK